MPPRPQRSIAGVVACHSTLRQHLPAGNGTTSHCREGEQRHPRPAGRPRLGTPVPRQQLGRATVSLRQLKTPTVNLPKAGWPSGEIKETYDSIWLTVRCVYIPRKKGETQVSETLLTSLPPFPLSLVLLILKPFQMLTPTEQLLRRLTRVDWRAV